MGKFFTVFKKLFLGVMFCLERPIFVVALCFFCVASSLVAKGSLIKLYQLRAEIKKVRSETTVLGVQVAALNQQLTRARDPSFLERKAMDEFEYASDEDLVFVFPEE